MDGGIILDVLPAGFGDCPLVSCPAPSRTWRMLVDTGPDETYPALRRRLLAIPPAADGRRHIDLFVVTQIDHDHIGGTRLLLEDADLRLSFGDIRFNAPPKRKVRGVADGESLAKILGGPEAALPRNLAWSGEAVVTPAGQGGVELAADGLPRLTVLSPTPGRLQALWKVWAKELEKLQRKERDKVEAGRGPTRGALDLEALARKRTALDRAVPNGSSIAILLEYQGASVQLCGDAFADVLVPELQALALKRGQPAGSPLAVDVLKLSHHGSRANVTTDLLKAVEAKDHVLSTNNAYFKHPNAEALARVIAGTRRPVLWFNHDTPQNRQWADAVLMQRYQYEVRYPASGRPENGDGVVIALPGTETQNIRTTRRLRS